MQEAQRLSAGKKSCAIFDLQGAQKAEGKTKQRPKYEEKEMKLLLLTTLLTASTLLSVTGASAASQTWWQGILPAGGYMVGTQGGVPTIILLEEAPREDMRISSPGALGGYQHEGRRQSAYWLTMRSATKVPNQYIF